MADSVSIYRRRPKCFASDKENKDELDAPARVPSAKSSGRKKGQATWIDRSLSNRSNIYTFSASRQTNDKAKQAFTSPNVYRKKRVEAPADFVREQKSYFEQVDAFELEEESPPPKDRWMPESHQKDATASCSRGLLQAVQEDSLEELPNDDSKCHLFSQKDSLSHILETPQSVQSLRNLKTAGPTRSLLDGKVQEAVHGRRPIMVEQPACCKAPAALKEPYPFIILSSDDEDENVEARNQPERFLHHIRQAPDPGKAKARQTVLQVIDIDVSPVLLSRDFNRPNVAPVIFECSKGLSSSKKLPASRDLSQRAVKEVATELLATIRPQNAHSYQAEEGLVDQIKKLEFQALKDKNCSEFSKLDGDCASNEQLSILNIHSPKREEKLPIFEALLKKCGQTVALPLEEAIMQFSDTREVVKLGEGTYGEAFRASNLVFKIVPMDGSFPVNGEPQKTLEEMHTEMLLMLTLNRFHKENNSDFNMQCNACNNFIETKMVKVCQGFYGQALIKAWEEWCTKHDSENDHPKVFPENQLYMLFVLADGGKDLESFSIDSFDVARSILIQVTVALAIAEADCEFEHRDLHWGNILVAQTKSNELYCKLNGTDMLIQTCGVLVHIIDFTLSRLFTGKEVLFSDLSADPLLFEGPKGDIQAEVYRKMLHLTKGQWDKRFLKTNCYWIHYLVDILLTRKKFPCVQQESRALRAFKKRVLSYDSARACLRDQFFHSVMAERL